MAQYTYEIVETLVKVVKIEAESEKAAYRKLKDKYRSEDYVLTSEDYLDTEFHLLEKNPDANKSPQAPKLLTNQK